jgi:thymidylate synthase (FAD)
MKTTLIDYMGTDLSVVNAARVSFAKQSEWLSEAECPTDPVHGGKIPPYKRLSDQDTKLINYLAKHNHWTPFAHTTITLHIKAPLFVARQLGKHQVGLVWNEVSRRYVTDEPEFYVPEVWRKAAENVKQGSSDEEVNVPDIRQVWDTSLDWYEQLLYDGVCPEQARMVLPQSMYTEWYWTGNLYAFFNVWKLRTDPHTQRETQEVAKQIGDILAPLYPVSWKALTKSIDNK